MKEIKLGLCRGRHEIPDVEGYIYPQNLDPVNVDGIQQRAYDVLYSNGDDWQLSLYVTGLTVALVAVIKACRERDIPLTLYHYNRETGEYYPQTV